MSNKINANGEETLEVKVVSRGADGIARTFTLIAKEDEMDDFRSRFNYFSDIYISRIYRYLVRDCKRSIKKNGTLEDALSNLSNGIPSLYLEGDKIFFLLRSKRCYVNGKWYVFWMNYINS